MHKNDIYKKYYIYIYILYFILILLKIFVWCNEYLYDVMMNMLG